MLVKPTCLFTDLLSTPQKKNGSSIMVSHEQLIVELRKANRVEHLLCDCHSWGAGGWHGESLAFLSVVRDTIIIQCTVKHIFKSHWTAQEESLQVDSVGSFCTEFNQW